MCRIEYFFSLINGRSSWSVYWLHNPHLILGRNGKRESQIICYFTIKRTISGCPPTQYGAWRPTQCVCLFMFGSLEYFNWAPRDALVYLLIGGNGAARAVPRTRKHLIIQIEINTATQSKANVTAFEWMQHSACESILDSCWWRAIKFI